MGWYAFRKALIQRACSHTPSTDPYKRNTSASVLEIRKVQRGGPCSIESLSVPARQEIIRPKSLESTLEQAGTRVVDINWRVRYHDDIEIKLCLRVRYRPLIGPFPKQCASAEENRVLLKPENSSYLRFSCSRGAAVRAGNFDATQGCLLNAKQPRRQKLKTDGTYSPWTVTISNKLGHYSAVAIWERIIKEPRKC